MKKKEPSIPSETSAFLLAEEALQLLQQTGVVAASVYVIGTLPFLLGLIFYWSAMSHSAHAHNYASAGAFLLALLFVWMKALQARFAQHLRCRLMDSELTPWTLNTFFRTLCRQAVLHATVIVVYPVGFVTLIPMAISAGWYQNISVLDDGREMSLKSLSKDALTQALLWQRQNHVLLWLSSPLLVVAGTAIFLVTFPVMDGLEQGLAAPSMLLSLGAIYGGLVLLAMVPLAPAATVLAAAIGFSIFFLIELFHILSGADTLYARNPGALLGNSTFLALVCALTYGALDPVLKAAYAIRCHQGHSLHSGDDLRVALQRIQKNATRAVAALLVVAIAGGVIGATPVFAQESSAARSASLDSALEKELSHARYTWRMPRTPRTATEMPWLLQALNDLAAQVREWVVSAYRWMRDVWKSFREWLSGDETGSSREGWLGSGISSIRLLMIVLGILLVFLTGYLLWYALRQNRPVVIRPMAALDTEAPDLESETTTAAEMPEDEWFKLAQQLAASGDFRLASRALFFSILATLAQREIIRIARFKSNMDYEREVLRRSSSVGEAPTHFSESALLYESVWYGEHEANAEVLNRMHACQEQLRHAIQ